MSVFGRLFEDDSGATAIEYGLIASLIAVALIGGAKAVGVNITAMFANVGANLTSP